MAKSHEKGPSLELDAKRFKKKINEYARKSSSEEQLKIKVEGLLQEIIAKFFAQGEEPEVIYERKTKISGKREDALYGTVIIEYKAPKKLDTGSEFVKAKEQIVGYLQEETGGDVKNFGKFFGVILDGYKISFVKYRRDQWIANEPAELSEESVYRLLEAIIALRRKAIDADLLLTDFGPDSETSEKVISILYAALEKSESSRTAMLFKDWKRVFSQVCAYSPSKLEALIEHYHVGKPENVDVEKLMFAVHTYYTLVMKLLTAEVISYFNPVFGSPLQRIENAYLRSREELKEELFDLEEGGIIAKIGIRNFLEADYFAWYLDEWNDEVVKGVIEIGRKLNEYDPATVELDPERVKDLFKRLYQNLVPKKVRHDLGEYFTPDWLAELVLGEVEYDGNVDKRVLDPACGSGEKDLSMLFTCVAAHRYLKKGEKLAFLITQEVFKAKGAGEGFRNFRVKGNPIKVLKAHDLVSLKPFENAANKTALIVLRKGEVTDYPVPYILWKKKRGKRLDMSISYDDALERTERDELLAKPIGTKKSSWQTFQAGTDEVLDKLHGKSIYKARRGGSIEPYGVYYMNIEQVFSDGTILVENLPELGKRKISKVEERIESDLVFSAVRGGDIKRWNAEPEVYVLIAQDPKKRVGYKEEWMKLNLPRSYGYLYRFKDILLSRGSNVVRELAEKTSFYTMYGIGEYTFAAYKVVWKRMANDITAVVLSKISTPIGEKDEIPTDTTSLIAFNGEDEAHYVCAILNSSVVRFFIQSYSSAGRGFGAPSIIKHLRIPKYAKSNLQHQKLSSLSKKAHELAKKHYEQNDLNEVEEEIDRCVADLYEIRNDELEEIKKVIC